MNSKRVTYIVGLLVLAVSLQVGTVQAQSTVFNNVRVAIKAGSAKELINFFHDTVELNLNGERARYSKAQAEFVMRDFFRANPIKEFDYVHKGSSREGIVYAIGRYSYEGGSYRVWLRLKDYDGNYRVYTLDIMKE